MLKLCFSTLGCVEKSFCEIIGLAERHSIAGLELRGMDGEIDTLKTEQFQHNSAESTLALLDSHGLRAVVLGTSVSFHDKERISTAMEEGMRSIDAAAEFGIPFIRVFGNLITEDKDACYGRVIDGLTRLCDYASERAVTVLLEVHGDYNSIEALSPVLSALGELSSFGLIWDVCHSHRVYGKNFDAFYEFIRPYVRHVHIKDISDNIGALTLLGDGDIPLVPIIKRLLADGYDGYISLEWERFWHRELPDIEVALDSLDRLLDHI